MLEKLVYVILIGCSVYTGWAAIARKDWVTILVAATAVVLLLGQLGAF